MRALAQTHRLRCDRVRTTLDLPSFYITVLSPMYPLADRQPPTLSLAAIATSIKLAPVRCIIPHAVESINANVQDARSLLARRDHPLHPHRDTRPLSRHLLQRSTTLERGSKRQRCGWKVVAFDYLRRSGANGQSARRPRTTEHEPSFNTNRTWTGESEWWIVDR